MFSFFKRKPAVIHTYKHIVWYMPEELSTQEKDMIANTSSVIIKILKNKLMVVAIYSMRNSTNIDSAKTQWKQELINELIWYFSEFKVDEEKVVIPLDWQNF